jgi:hypothetical protein
MKTIANHSSALGCVIALVLLLVASPAFSQSQSKVVQWSGNFSGSYHPKTAPEVQWFSQIDGLEIQGFAVGGKSITMREPFAADDDWLRDFTVRVKNVSQQTLLSIQLDLATGRLLLSVYRQEHGQGENPAGRRGEPGNASSPFL